MRFIFVFAFVFIYSKVLGQDFIFVFDIPNDHTEEFLNRSFQFIEEEIEVSIHKNDVLNFYLASPVFQLLGTVEFDKDRWVDSKENLLKKCKSKSLEFFFDDGLSSVGVFYHLKKKISNSDTPLFCYMVIQYSVFLRVKNFFYRGEKDSFKISCAENNKIFRKLYNNILIDNFYYYLNNDFMKLKKGSEIHFLVTPVKTKKTASVFRFLPPVRKKFKKKSLAGLERVDKTLPFFPILPPINKKIKEIPLASINDVDRANSSFYTPSNPEVKNQYYLVLVHLKKNIDSTKWVVNSLVDTLFFHRHKINKSVVDVFVVTDVVEKIMKIKIFPDSDFEDKNNSLSKFREKIDKVSQGACMRLGAALKIAHEVLKTKLKNINMKSDVNAGKVVVLADFTDDLYEYENAIELIEDLARTSAAHNKKDFEYRKLMNKNTNFLSKFFFFSKGNNKINYTPSCFVEKIIKQEKKERKNADPIKKGRVRKYLEIFSALGVSTLFVFFGKQARERIKFFLSNMNLAHIDTFDAFREINKKKADCSVIQSYPLAVDLFYKLNSSVANHKEVSLMDEIYIDFRNKLKLKNCDYQILDDNLPQLNARFNFDDNVRFLSDHRRQSTTYNEDDHQSYEFSFFSSHDFK